MVVDSLSAVFAGLSDPTRRAIVDRLMQGPATVNDLAAPFAMTQQAVSKHLTYLQQAHIIRKERRGRQQMCSLRPEAIRAVAAWTHDYRKMWNQGLERLEILLESLEKEEQ